MHLHIEKVSHRRVRTAALADLQRRISPSTLPPDLAAEVHEIASHRTPTFTVSL